MNDLIGREVEFAAIPYHYGRGVIKTVAPMEGMWAGYHLVTITTTDAHETSRLFGATSRQPYNNREIRLYPFREETIRSAVGGGEHLRYTYPV